MDRPIEASVLRGRRWRRIAIGAACLGAAAALLTFLPSILRPGVSRDRIRTGRVSRGALETAVQASGLVVPAFEMSISSPVEARVERILKRSGDQVALGDELFVLDISAVKLEVDRLARALELKRNERAQQQLGLEETSRDLAGRAERQRLELEMLRYRESQTRSLFEAGLASEQALKEAQVAAAKAGIELSQLEESAAHARRTNEVKLAGLALEGDTLEQEWEEARRQLRLATTRSDRAGVLTWTLPQEGVTVRKGEVIARIADLSAFRVEATVSDVHAGRVAAGQPARVVVEGRRLAGRVSAIQPAVENGTLRFQVDLDDPGDAALRQNLRVDVLALTETRDAILTLARGPFAQGGAIQQVFVIHGAGAVRTQARFGATGWESYEVLEGLSEGDEVILSDMRDYLHAASIRIR
jgi:HlyD family secretion protein